MNLRLAGPSMLLCEPQAQQERSLCTQHTSAMESPIKRLFGITRLSAALQGELQMEQEAAAAARAEAAAAGQRAQELSDAAAASEQMAAALQAPPLVHKDGIHARQSTTLLLVPLCLRFQHVHVLFIRGRGCGPTAG